MESSSSEDDDDDDNDDDDDIDNKPGLKGTVFIRSLFK